MAQHTALQGNSVYEFSPEHGQPLIMILSHYPLSHAGLAQTCKWLVDACADKGMSWEEYCRQNPRVWAQSPWRF